VANSLEDRVNISRDEPDPVDAIVQGAGPYAVELLLEAGHPVWSCSCPAAAEGALCKHAVATALALAGTAAAPAGTPTSAAGLSTLRRKAVAGPDVRAWRKRVTSTFAAGGRFVEYRDAPEWAAGVHELLDEVEELLAAGYADVVVTLGEDAHRRAETALHRIDDSGGCLTDISHRVAKLHQAAFARARPGARALTDRLFKLEVDSHTLDTFHRAAATYAEALGAAGIDRYRELVGAACRIGPAHRAWSERMVANWESTRSSACSATSNSWQTPLGSWPPSSPWHVRPRRGAVPVPRVMPSRRHS
jgi:hypothetical protein